MKKKIPIDLHSEDIAFELVHQAIILPWIVQSISHEGFACKRLRYVFCSDAYLHGLNVLHLDHDTYTDIITFDYTEKEKICGEMFISIDRVRENATELQVPFLHELCRVMIHGVLHLCGYQDHSDEAEAEMRQKEDFYLHTIKHLWSNI